MSNIATLPVDREAGTDLATADFSSNGLLLDFRMIEKMNDLAKLMATATIAVPAHFRGKPGDCLAVVMQSAQWGMNPFAVAQKCFSVNGTLGYEAQLVGAVVNTRAPIVGRLQYEWFGPWERILGKFIERESKTKKDDNGYPIKYRAPGWDIKDEEGLGVTIRATLRGEQAPRELTLLMTQARTRNSTLWADDPKQQLAYLATKRWARLYCPEVILGVYTPDELAEPMERDMGEAVVVGEHIPATQATSNSRTEALKSRMGVGQTNAPAAPDLAEVIAAIDQAETPEAMQAAADMASKLTSDDDKAKAGKRYKARLQELKKAATQAEPEPDPQQDAPTVSFAQVADRLNKAEDIDLLDIAADFISQVPNPEHQEELRQLYHARREKLAGE